MAIATQQTTLTPAALTPAVYDMEAAFTDGHSRTASLPAAEYTEVGAGIIGGMTLTTGVYKWTSDVSWATDIKFSGKATDVL